MAERRPHSEIVVRGESSCSSAGGDGGGGSGSSRGKYVRYTSEQLEALEYLYAECKRPSSARRRQLIRDCPALAKVESQQIKVWFQNRRCREKQKNGTIQIQEVNTKLTSMNKSLMEENERLQTQVSKLVFENLYMRRELQNDSATHSSCDSVLNMPQHVLGSADNLTGFLSFAEETKAKFLSKATGSAVDWVQIPGMKPGPDVIGIVAISESCNGVGARVSGLVPLEPQRIMEIIKDRQSWFRDCRKLEVFAKFSAGNRGTIELIYMQIYAPTTLAPARDFWTLRYTTSLVDGSLVVCEGSMAISGAGPKPSATVEFVRGKMLPSGYLIRPCEGGGSIVHIVDHLDFEAGSVLEVLQPLYMSSKLVAQKKTIAALHYLREVAQETGGEVTHASTTQSAVLRAFSQRLSRGFNDAVNGFEDDGWLQMKCGAAEDLIISVNSTMKTNAISNSINAAASSPKGVLCVKASMLLHNVYPALLVQFLREHRSEWADCNVDAYSAALLEAGSFVSQGLSPTHFCGSQSVIPLGHTMQNEILDLIQLEGRGFNEEEAGIFKNIRLLQICNGVSENAVAACSELVFAPVNELFPTDAPLLSSGFRILPLDSKAFVRQDTSSVRRRLDPKSVSGVHLATRHSIGSPSSSNNMSSVLVIAFQFPFEVHLKEIVGAMARLYIRNVISAVQRIAMAINPSGPRSHLAPKVTPCSEEALSLAQWVYQSYSLYLGVNFLSSSGGGDDPILKQLWHHHSAIMCCSLKFLPVFTFSNQSGLNMLETSLATLQDFTLDKLFDQAGWNEVCSLVPKIMDRGYAFLETRYLMSTEGRRVSYEQALAWKVLGGDNSVVCLAFAFINWSFV